MNDQELISIIEKLNFSPDELKAWRELIPALTPEEKKELSDKLTAIQSEKNTLAVEQANDLADLLSEWKSPADIIP